MRKPLIVLCAIFLLTIQSSQLSNVDNDIVFEEGPTKNTEEGLITRVLNRVKRQWLFFGSDDSSTTSTESSSPSDLSTTTEAASAFSSRETRSPPDDEITRPSERQPPDDEDEDNLIIASGDVEGSGEVPGPTHIPFITDHRSPSALYRIRLLVEQPWDDEYILPSSDKFKDFAARFKREIELLYEPLPGEQTAEVISITQTQNLLFSKVTVDLKSEGNADPKSIENHILRQVEDKRRIGEYIVDTNGFNFFVFKECSSSEIVCPLSGFCVPVSDRCNGNENCPDGEDEKGCESSTETYPSTEATVSLGESSTAQIFKDEFSTTETAVASSTPPEELKCRGDTTPITCEDDQDVKICPDKKCNGIKDCPNGEDERNCPSSSDCLQNEFACDVGRCIPEDWVCNGVSDCSDKTDESPNLCKSRPCENGDFRCRSGKCIPYTKFCDFVEDCPDGDDEKNCNTRCSPEEFQCSNGQCVSSSARCNGKSDCYDRSDEENCPRECSSIEWQCDNGDCIRSSLRCNLQTDCLDGSDEKDCMCPGEWFMCKNNHCIPMEKRCDKQYDCNDRSDEWNCNDVVRPTPFVCPIGEVFCSSGDQCFNMDDRCNGHVDCHDGSDEKGCCRSDEFTCADGFTCIRLSAKCDGRQDCSGGEDERNCAGVCHDTQFRCSYGACIPYVNRCDGRSDCADSSDEEGCDDNVIPCTEDEFRCRNGDCVFKDYVCDNHRDCSDGSDEDNCDSRACEPTDFRCYSDQSCISSSKLCDDHVDCRDGSDEDARTCKTCRPTEFQCNTGDCIPLVKRCDGRPDCIDNSDETNNDCQTVTYTPQPYSCGENEFSCWRGGCIPSHQHCNGQYDCADRSDEENCAGTPPPELRIYEGDQIIKETREAVFRCRDEGLGRFRVRWFRERGLPLPPGSRDLNGRLEMPNIQREHTGTYYCEAVGIPSNLPGSRVSVHLTVEPLLLPTHPPFPAACGPGQATCYNRECIMKSQVCDGHFDCGDGSDESRCHKMHQSCEPNEFHCNNRKCILKSWYCDKEDDCGDGSDEIGCDIPKPGTGCNENEFECHSKNQCIPRHYHCDNTNDCQDGTDEIGCFPMRIVVNPPPFRNLPISSTLVITCEAIGVPVPVISWRWNWKNVPPKCTMESVDGKGTLTCPDMQPQDSGAYSCEAINTVTYIIGNQDTIVTVHGETGVCENGTFNEMARTQRECINCFCFGATENCESAKHYVYRLPPPRMIFRLLNVYISPNWVDVRVHEESSFQPHLRSNDDGFKIQSSYGSRAYESIYPYYVLPEPIYQKEMLESYGGYLSYYLLAENIDQQLDIPDIIITGNGRTLLYKHPYPIPENSFTVINASISEGAGWEVLKANESRYPARREDIMMTLVNVDKILLRTEYTEGQGLMTALANVTMDSASINDSGFGKAPLVERCVCPAGYTGLSCEKCSEGYVRNARGPWLGDCVRDEVCPRGYYGDPSRNIPCRKCACPYTSPPNQFSEVCRLSTDFRSAVCDCPEGYMGDRCERCAPGWEGNPLQPGGSCRRRPEPQCNSAGSISPYPRNDECICKESVTGPTCSQCVPGTFHLSPNNPNGCISCFCMGVTKNCNSSSLYRDQITVSFGRDNEGVKLVAEDDVTSEVDARVVPGSMELSYDNFQPKVYYWILPRKFLEDQVKSYGGFLEYRLRYVPTPGGQSSRNNAAIIKLYSKNGVNLFYYGNSSAEPDRTQSIKVPLLEQYWQLENGGQATRDYFLRALTGIKDIYLKATFTTNTDFAALQFVSLDTANYYYTNRGPASEVEECQCPPGYKGLSCQHCDVGYKKTQDMERCIRCECNGRSTECHPETGECYNCQDNWQGPQCEICPRNYTVDSYQRCVPSLCECDSRGVSAPGCVDGRCICKVNVEGEYCERCRAGTFNLDRENTFGCSECYCSGVSDTCQSSNLYYEPLPVVWLEENHGFILSDRNGRNVISDGFSRNPSMNEIGYSFFTIPEDYYWSLPPKFVGDKITSYGGKLIFTQRYTSRGNGYPEGNFDVILSGNGKSIYWRNDNLPRSNEPKTVYVLIKEGQWRRTDPRTGHSIAQRQEILEILSQLSSIQIRATFGRDTQESFLSDVSMDVAIPGSSGRAALEVEFCRCPPAYTGTSCQQCEKHFYKDYDNTCKPCRCNNHEESCSIGSDNQLHCTCQSGWTGKSCESNGCTGTYFRDYNNNCTRCPCNNREISCELGSQNEIICFCEEGYSGRYCEKENDCSGGYYQDKDNACKKCPCNDRESDCFLSSENNIVCNCQSPYAGPKCETNACAGGYFSDYNNECRRCPCNNREISCEFGSDYEIVCFCQEGYSGRYCETETVGTMVHITPGGTLNQRLNDKILFTCYFYSPEYVYGDIELVYSTSMMKGISYSLIPVDQKSFRHQGNVQRIVTIEPGLQRVVCRVYNWKKDVVGLSTAAINIDDASQIWRNGTKMTDPEITVVIADKDSTIEIKEIGSTVRYTCSILRSSIRVGPVRLVWSKIGGDLPYGRATDDRQGNLEIVDLKVSDSGMYVCTAESDVGSATQQVTLKVGDQHVPPTINIVPQTIEVRDGDAIEVVCQSKGTPQPTLQWRRAYNETFNPRAEIIYGTLKIPYASRSDAGRYECIARNDAGYDIKSITIYVTDKPGPEDIHVIINPPSIDSVPGERVTLNCDVTSDSDYEIEWRRENNRPLPYYAMKSGNQLLLTRTSPEDSGIYICMVRSRITGRSIGKSTARITITSSQSYYPSITPARQQLPQGHTAEFTCNLPYDLYPGSSSVMWLKSQGNISERAEYLNEGRILRIPSLTIEDRGIYICNTLYQGRTQFASAMLEVERREAPSIELYPADKRQILLVGNSLLLQCRVTGIPPPVVTWSRADNITFPNNIVPSSGGVLRFNRVRLSDAGNYICTAQNEAGRISLTAHIEVQSPPEVRVHPSDSIRLRTGDMLHLTCTAEGTPTPSVRWTKHDPYSETYYSYDQSVRGFAEPNFGSSEYQVLQVSSEDEGIYYCVAENNARKEVKSVQVTVDDSFDYPTPGPPAPEGDTLWVAMGEDTQMSCIIDGNRNLERQWVRADGGNFPPGVTQRDGTLYIRGASSETEGEYVCLVLDEQGRVEKRIGRYLHVKSLPEITLEPPRQVVRPGDDAEILCSARGEQPIEIIWKANHSLSSHVHINGGLLSFRGITERDAGRYVCLARNIVGLREAAAEVIVNDNGINRPSVTVVGNRSRTAPEGATLDLECRSDVPASEVSWTLSNGPLPPNAVRFGSILRIMRAELRNSGRYVCTIHTSSGTIGSSIIDLTITQEHSCPGFQCRSGECVDRAHRCDKIQHCADSSDELYCPRRRRGTHRVGLKIEPSIDVIRVGSTVDLKCVTEGIPTSSIVWKKVGEEGLDDNVVTISPSILRIIDVTTRNAGTYRCFVQTESGTHIDDYTLNVQDGESQQTSVDDYDDDNASTPSPAAKTVTLKLGESADITCSNDLEPPVKYHWIRQGGLPQTALSEEGKLYLKKVTAKDSGLYTCVATNGEVKMEIPTFVVVRGTIPKFTQTSQSYLKLKTLYDALMQFDIEILFKPEQPNGLILFNGKRHPSASGASDFISFGLRDGYPEFKFDVGSGHATIVGRSPLEMGKWVRARLIRNRKEGRLIINNEDPVIGTSPGRHHSLDLDLPLYIGSVPDFNDIPKSVDYVTGFRGCIARLVIKNEEQTLTRSGALEWTGISECDTCSENTCTNSGACQEFPNLRGYICLCPRGFSGENCDHTGESCYPGLCGDGYCENTEKGFQCKCQLGLAGSNCEHRIHIRTPSFEDSSYIAYPTPRSTEKLDITLKLNPSDSRDALILYAAQNDFGSGNFLSLALKDRRLEFRMDTGSGSPIIVRSNTEVIPGSWMTITAGRDLREARLSIGQDLARTTLTSGQRQELILGTNLYLGGFDSSLGSIHPGVGVTDGFRGCISHIEVSRMDLDILKSSKESSNVRECPSGNPCRDSPCLNGATCQQDGSSYICHCTPDFSGRHCDRFKNDCERFEPCGSKGECIPLSLGYRCHCAKGFSGQNCTMREHFTTSFSINGDGWVELPKSILSGVGDETEVEMSVVTSSREGMLLWHGQEPRTAGGSTDFFSIGVSEGKVKVIFELGSGLGEVTSNRRIDDGLPHNIRVSRNGNLVSLTIDGDSVDGQSDGFLSKLNAQGNIYIGGLPDPRYMTNGRYIHNFNGCIKNLRIQNSDEINVSTDSIATVNVVKCPV